MSFQTRILLIYSSFIVLLISILGSIFYRQSAGAFEENACSSLAVISEKMSQQLDNVIHPMEFITTQLLSDSTAISSLTSLAAVNRDDPRNIAYIDDARRKITGILETYAIDRSFYRVNVFNNRGDFITSNFRILDKSGDLTGLIGGFGWTKDADSRKGKFVVLPPYRDPWAVNGIRVFGLARSVQWPNSGMGYIEIQNPYSQLEDIFAVPDKASTKVIAVVDSGELFYSGGLTDQPLLDYYAELAADGIDSVSVVRNAVTGEDEIVAASGSDYTGISIVIAQDRDVLLEPLLFTRNTTFLICFIVIAVSLVYIYIFSRQLTKPIRRLKEKMEETELGNLRKDINLHSSNNEIESLNGSFQKLLERLRESVSREIKSQSMQMQASFDSLQAQVNPHFIYNILNVLSNKGIELGDHEICEICESIAAMLRYSTSTKKRTATIEEELNHVQNYLTLMKKRYEHRLEFNIDADQSIMHESIPKIVLQQIAENSITHGFMNGQKVIKIGIRGYSENGWWYVEITDNGRGFEPGILSELESRMGAVEKDLSGSESQDGYEIGGMGLINIYGRMALFTGGKYVFRLENRTDGGAKVIIGGIIGTKKGEGEEQ
jgi:two-component system sensor histidine kinase YesM